MTSLRPQRQSWKRSPEAPRNANGTARRGQWLLSLLAVVLTVLLGWIVWRQLERADRTRFIAIVAGNHAKLSVPSLPFGHHDLRPFTEQPHRFLDFQDASPLLEAARIGQLSDELKRLQLGKRDTLILYISAHGVANLQAEGQAHLLCRDFDLNKPDQACLGIDQLLQQVARLRGGTQAAYPGYGLFAHGPPPRPVDQ